MEIIMKYICSILLGLTLGTGCELANPDDVGNLVPPTCDQDPLLPQTEISVAGHSRSIHIETFGDTSLPVLFVLHGSASDYRAYLPLHILSEKYYMVFWDQRGCGLSERISLGEITWDAVIDEIDAIKNMYSPHRAITIIGHSWGGAYATLYTSRRMEAVRQLVLLEPGPALNVDVFDKTINTLFTLDFSNEVMNDTQWMNELLSVSDHEQMDYRYLMNVNSSMMNYFVDPDHLPDWPVWRIGSYVEYGRQYRIMNDKDFDFACGMDQFSNEVLIVGSDHSILGYTFQKKYHQPLFGNAKTVCITQSGHRMITEQFDQLYTTLTDYLIEYSSGDN